MEPVHRIHLGNAWEPTRASGGWQRHFGLPAGLGPGSRLWLVIERPMACRLSLNGQALPAAVAGSDYRHEVGGLLARRNELVLLPEQRGGEPIAPHDPLPSTTMARRALPAACGCVWLEIVERVS